MGRVVLSGYYGMSNYGDDLFAVISFLSAQKYWKGFKPEVLAPAVRGASIDYAVPSVVGPQLYGSNDYRGAITRLLFTTTASLYSSKFVFAGGSVFHSSSFGSRYLAFKLRRKKDFFSAIGVSVGPFKSSKEEAFIREQLKRFEYVSVRDNISYQRVKNFDLDLKLENAGDLAGLCIENDLFRSGSFPFKKSRENILVGFSPCFVNSDEKSSLEYCDDFIDAVLTSKFRDSLSVEIICLNEHPASGDAALCKYVQRRLLEESVKANIYSYKLLGVFETWNLISSLNVYFSVRLHGAITAYLTKVPFFLFEYHEKCSEFLDVVGEEKYRIRDNSVISRDLSCILDSLLEGEASDLFEPQDYAKLSRLNFLASPLCKAD